MCTREHRQAGYRCFCRVRWSMKGTSGSLRVCRQQGEKQNVTQIQCRSVAARLDFQTRGVHLAKRLCFDHPPSCSSSYIAMNDLCNTLSPSIPTKNKIKIHMKGSSEETLAIADADRRSIVQDSSKSRTIETRFERMPIQSKRLTRTEGYRADGGRSVRLRSLVSVRRRLEQGELEDTHMATASKRTTISYTSMP